MAQHNNVPYRLQVGRRGKTVNYHQAYDNRTLLGDAGRATGKAGQNIYPNRSHRLSNRIVLDGPSVRRSKLGQQDRVLPPNYIADYVRALLDEGATQVTVAYPERTHMREIGLQPNVKFLTTRAENGIEYPPFSSSTCCSWASLATKGVSSPMRPNETPPRTSCS
jgi:hypothetical protein